MSNNTNKNFKHPFNDKEIERTKRAFAPRSIFQQESEEDKAKKVKEIVQSSFFPLIVKTTSLNLRFQPDGNSEIVATVKSNQKLDAFSNKQTNGYYKVLYAGVECFVNANYVELDPVFVPEFVDYQNTEQNNDQYSDQNAEQSQNDVLA